MKRQNRKVGVLLFLFSICLGYSQEHEDPLTAEAGKPFGERLPEGQKTKLPVKPIPSAPSTYGWGKSPGRPIVRTPARSMVRSEMKPSYGQRLDDVLQIKSAKALFFLAALSPILGGILGLAIGGLKGLLAGVFTGGAIGLGIAAATLLIAAILALINL